MLERSKPYTILVYEALFRRLKEVYRNNKTINDDYQKFNAGFWGEKSVDYKLRIFPKEKYLLYYGLRLINDSLPFQMDTLILTEKFICILEIKNLKGKLIYDSQQSQLIQVVDDLEIGYKDPILQAETQKMNLNFWLQKHHVDIPIETLVVSSNPSTIITNTHNDPEFKNKFIHAESLPFQLNKLDNKYTNKILSRDQLKKISNSLLKGHTPLVSKSLDKYGITERHLIKGIPCPSCNHYPMKRLYRRWSCSKCLYTDTTAHVRVILDYFLLVKDTITNKECRELLQINSSKTAYILLKSMGLTMTGNTRGRKYHAPNPDNFPQHSTFPNNRKFTLDLVGGN